MDKSESLMKTPFSEISATLESLAHAGCTFEHLKAIRGSFDEEVAEAICRITGLPLSFPKEEEFYSDYEYPPDFEYFSLAMQIDILKKSFPHLKLPTQEALEGLIEMPVPKDSGAERLYVIPKWHTFNRDYNIAVRMIVLSVFNAFGFSCDRIDLEFDCVRQCEWKKKMMSYIDGKQQSIYGDFFIIPAQFGLSHRGRSSRRALEMMDLCPDLNFVEFGLGLFEISAMLLTHQTRFELGSNKNLSLFCAGDEYSPDGKGSFHCVPYYLVDGNGNLSVGSRHKSNYFKSFGTPSGFFPKPKK